MFKIYHTRPHANTDNMASNSGNLRERTFVINFSEALKKPKIETVTDYLFNIIAIASERIRSVQANLSRGITYVEVDDEEYAMQIVETHDRKHEVRYEDYKFTVPLHMEDGTTLVKVHDLPPQMGNDLIKQEMSRFGEVLSIKNETWESPSPLKGIINGVRAIRIRLQEQIPSYINIAGHFTLVTHKNQLITCRHCGRAVHIGMRCADVGQLLQNRTSVNDRLNRGGSSYANQLRGPTGNRHTVREDSGANNAPTMTNLNELNKEKRTNTSSSSSTDTTKRELSNTSKQGNSSTRVTTLPVLTGTCVVSKNIFNELLMEQTDNDGNISDSSMNSITSNASRKRLRRQRSKQDK